MSRKTTKNSEKTKKKGNKMPLLLRVRKPGRGQTPWEELTENDITVAKRSINPENFERYTKTDINVYRDESDGRKEYDIVYERNQPVRTVRDIDTEPIDLIPVKPTKTVDELEVPGTSEIPEIKDEDVTIVVDDENPLPTQEDLYEPKFVGPIQLFPGDPGYVEASETPNSTENQEVLGDYFIINDIKFADTERIKQYIRGLDEKTEKYDIFEIENRLTGKEFKSWTYRQQNPEDVDTIQKSRCILGRLADYLFGQKSFSDDELKNKNYDVDAKIEAGKARMDVYRMWEGKKQELDISTYADGLGISREISDSLDETKNTYKSFRERYNGKEYDNDILSEKDDIMYEDSFRGEVKRSSKGIFGAIGRFFGNYIRN